MEKLDVTFIILTYNEEIHIKRCLENVSPIAKDVVVIDCISTDRTQEICQEFDNVRVIEHPWPGNQATQFNWALDNVDITTSWIFRLDADEYLTPELIEEMQAKLPKMNPEVSAVVLPLGRAFQGRVLKHGIVKGIKMIRLFRTGKVRYEQRLMDEHLQVLEGEPTEFQGKFVDDSLIGIRAFVAKHNSYSDREAALLLDAEFGLTELPQNDNTSYAEEVAAKRKQKEKYAKMPLFWRSVGYFCYRYFAKLGFLDGKEGFLWDFFQGLWYRVLVDAKVFEARKFAQGDKNLIIQYINEKLKVKLS